MHACTYTHKHNEVCTRLLPRYIIISAMRYRRAGVLDSRKAEERKRERERWWWPVENSRRTVYNVLSHTHKSMQLSCFWSTTWPQTSSQSFPSAQLVSASARRWDAHKQKSKKKKKTSQENNSKGQLCFQRKFVFIILSIHAWQNNPLNPVMYLDH